MSKIGNYVIEKEARGEFKYSPSEGVYLNAKGIALRDEIEYLEWQIQSLQGDLKYKKLQLQEL